jgi:hypothetical protein
LLDVLLLGVLVVLNYFALRWCVHQLTADGQWLRNHEERDEVLREYALTKVGQLFNPYQRDSLKPSLSGFGLVAADRRRFLGRPLCHSLPVAVALRPLSQLSYGIN